MEDDPRAEQALSAIAAVDEATDFMLQAVVDGKGVIGTTLWKRMDKELGVLQKLSYDLREFKIKNGLD